MSNFIKRINLVHLQCLTLISQDWVFAAFEFWNASFTRRTLAPPEFPIKTPTQSNYALNSQKQKNPNQIKYPRERESTWFVWGLEWTNRYQTKRRSCHLMKFLEFSLFRNKRFSKFIDELNSDWRGFNRWWWRMQVKQDKALPVPL